MDWTKVVRTRGLREQLGRQVLFRRHDEDDLAALVRVQLAVIGVGVSVHEIARDQTLRESEIATRALGLQRQVMELAVAGLSNKEIAVRLYLSNRTVGTHLYRLFPKLGIASRAELRDALPTVEEA